MSGVAPSGAPLPGTRSHRAPLPDARLAGTTVIETGRFLLESGEVLEDVQQAYRLDGTLDARRENVVLLFHSLTGSPADLGGWTSLVGPGRPIDTDRYAVLAPNLLGSCYGTRFRGSPSAARITTRDQACLVARLLDALEIPRVALVSGGSLGGMVALELVSTHPDRAEAALVFAAPAAASAWGTGWNHIHRAAIRLGGAKGLALARMVGMMTYRTPDELEARFRGEGENQPIRGYLSHHGEKLVGRFSRLSYETLLDAMDSHDVGRGRGGVARALAAFGGRVTGVGIRGDLLYPPAEVKSWVEDSGALYRQVESEHGHDSFLLEEPSVGRLFQEALALSVRAPERPATPGRQAARSAA